MAGSGAFGAVWRISGAAGLLIFRAVGEKMRLFFEKHLTFSVTFRILITLSTEESRGGRLACLTAWRSRLVGRGRMIGNHVGPYRVSRVRISPSPPKNTAPLVRYFFICCSNQYAVQCLHGNPIGQERFPVPTHRDCAQNAPGEAMDAFLAPYSSRMTQTDHPQRVGLCAFRRLLRGSRCLVKPLHQSHQHHSHLLPGDRCTKTKIPGGIPQQDPVFHGPPHALTVWSRDL